LPPIQVRQRRIDRRIDGMRGDSGLLRARLAGRMGNIIACLLHVSIGRDTLSLLMYWIVSEELAKEVRAHIERGETKYTRLASPQ
jgi:hypothetical protein